MMLFLLYRQNARALEVDGVGGNEPTIAIDGRPAKRPWRAWGLWYAIGRSLAVIGVGFVLFLVAPRAGNEQWNLLNPSSPAGQMETGFSNQIDLSVTGEVKISEEPAMEVYVEDISGHPVVDLSPEARWRGAALETYERGRLLARHRRTSAGLAPAAEVPFGDHASFFDAVPGQRRVRFDLDLWTAGGLFLAEPVATVRRSRIPVTVTSPDPPWLPYYHARDDCLILPSGPLSRQIRYEQIVPPSNGSDRTPAIAITDDYLFVLVRQPQRRLLPWTKEIAQRLVSQGRLDAEDLVLAPDPRQLGEASILPVNRAKVASALCDYLARSGEYTYRLENKRVDHTLDATEDFLRNVKHGYCEHYSIGLVLMLRSFGIPSRVVKGFRGAEHQGDEEGNRNGYYVIRQSHAHSWVEALVPDGTDDESLAWLTLDPTPGTEIDVAGGISWRLMWVRTRAWIQEAWKNLILDYNMDRQADTFTGLWNSALESGGGFPIREMFAGGPKSLRFWIVPGAAMLLGAAVCWVAWRFRRQPVSTMGTHVQAVFSGPPIPFYQRWLSLILRRLGRQPHLAQTPREFAMAIAGEVATARGGALGDFAHRVVNQFYRVRFGNYPVESPETTEIERMMDEWEQTQRGPHSPTSPSTTA
jgi:transglutaminase-like putative cysteine protease